MPSPGNPEVGLTFSTSPNWLKTRIEVVTYQIVKEQTVFQASAETRVSAETCHSTVSKKGVNSPSEKISGFDALPKNARLLIIGRPTRLLEPIRPPMGPLCQIAHG
jgi:hypothetical protein